MKANNFVKKKSMKIKLLTIALGIISVSSHAQSNFANLWTLQNTSNQVEIKIIDQNQSLQFVLEGLVDESSRIFMTGKLDVDGLNQYKYVDKNTDCSIKFNFLNADSLYIQSNACELYTLNDSISGLLTTNSGELITPKIFGQYDENLENEIRLKTDLNYEFVKSKSIFRKSIKTEAGEVIFMANTQDQLNKDPEIAYYIENQNLSIFYLNEGVITALRSPFHSQLDSNILEWMQKTRTYTIETTH